ncbi:MAG TPA: excinuclease ABC subunit UvrA [Gemmatimonadales bacterium]|jgi:excinuclease ABC subunit A|nr:excinuclease ABC subunit UvrA [Gemmatimonadales bacterium]
MAEEFLVVRGAREHNLKNVTVRIPRNALTVITGLSGSGKSSLAFDTIYAEGQRRYVESLSAYARQFLGLMEKPDVDAIEGLSPAISIQQKTTAQNPRSTVGTVTEIYDYMRLLWARAGTPLCPNDGTPIVRSSATQIADTVLSWPEGTRIEVLGPMVRGRKGEFKELFEDLRKRGYVRVRIDGETVDLAAVPAINRRQNHDIAVVVDRLVVRASDRSRLADSIETALRAADGVVEVVRQPGAKSTLFSERFACPTCGLSLPELEPRQFSFNSPFGACPECHGVGTARIPNADLVLGDPSISILEGVVLPWGEPTGYLRKAVLPTLARAFKFDLNARWSDIPAVARKALLEGAPGRKFKYTAEGGRGREVEGEWEGILAYLSRRYRESSSDAVRTDLEGYMVEMPCPACGGKRLRPESLSVMIAGRSVGDVVDLPVDEAVTFFEKIPVGRAVSGAVDPDIAGPILKEVIERLAFLRDVGLDYLTLGRSAGTLSGGEAQRIRLATQIGSRLVGVLYILDEPSIGLHQRDNARLLDTLRGLRDLGNTVIVVEHDEDTIRGADHVIDLGPRAGRLGGQVVAEGSLPDILASADSLTARYLRGELRIEVPARRPYDPSRVITVVGARENNLDNLTVAFPLGLFVAVTGVSGSGKSTLVSDILYRALARHFYRAKVIPGEHARITGLDHLDKVIDIDQSPIGRTPRSNPATYTGLFTPIRELFTQLPEAKLRGYGPGRFSFNVKGGRCEACQGDGLVRIEMHFLPDVYVPCEVCKGKRYNRETLEVRYKGRNIADVLELTVTEALDFFSAQGRIAERLELLNDVGLGYLHLGQAATTLSGGEAQRVKLATELAKRDTGRTLYILDEPTTGLHFEDVRLLLDVLHRLVAKGNSVVVIEHNLDVLKTADWVIDLGPGGGVRGGEVVAQGTPEEVAANPASYTGEFLKRILSGG